MSSFDIISDLVLLLLLLWPDPKIFLCIPASTADAVAVNPKGIKKLLANVLITFFINGNPVFSNGPSNQRRNPPDCIILDNWVFDKLISVDKWFAKTLRRFATCILVNNNLWGNLVSLSPIIFDDNVKTTLVSFFIAYFYLLSSEFDSFTFNLLYCVIFVLIKVKLLYGFCIYKTFTVSCENPKTVSFTSSRMK